MKIVMIGGAITKPALVPNEKGWEQWIINNVFHEWTGLRITRWFNLHHLKTLKKEYAGGLAQEIAWAWLHQKVPCYVLQSWAGALPNERIFPRKKLAAMPRGWYHCGSFDWMVAYAVLLGAKEISIHGVRLCTDSGEPMSARACLEYWIGYAEAKGCKVHFHDGDLFYNYHLVRDRKAYGYDDWDLLEDRS